MNVNLLRSRWLAPALIAGGSLLVLVAGTRTVLAAEPGVGAWTVGGPVARAVGLAGLAAAAGALLAGPYARMAVGAVAVGLPLLAPLVSASEVEAGWTSYPPDFDVLRLWAPVLWLGLATLAVGGVVCLLSGWLAARSASERTARRPEPGRHGGSMWDALDRGEDPTS